VALNNTRISILTMRIDKKRLNLVSTLEVSATEYKWNYCQGHIKTEQDKIVAYVCHPDDKPNFQQEADGEFIACIRNIAPELMEELSTLRQVNERLVKRVLRLEEELYGDS
jgi:hypothetical protein